MAGQIDIRSLMAARLEGWALADDDIVLLEAAERLRAGETLGRWAMAVQAFASICDEHRIFGPARERLRELVFESQIDAPVHLPG